MEFQDILTLIEKVSQSSLTNFSFRQDENGIQIEMKKEKKQTQKEEREKENVSNLEETETIQKEQKERDTKEESEQKEENEQEILAPMDGFFYYIEKKGPLLRVGKELNDEDGMEIGSIQDEDEMPYNLSVKCLGEVTKICVQDGQKVRKGDPLFIAKIEKGDTTVEVL